MVWRFVAALAVAVPIASAPAAAIAAPGKTVRSYAAKAEFKRLSPCPATGKKRGACPGWEVDHRIPLKCDGPDHHSNMQWLTIEEHKAKTRKEAKQCR